MSFENRIELSDIGVPFVVLKDKELDEYQGAGDAIAFVNNEGLVERIIYIHDIEQFGAKAACQDAIDHGNAYFGMMSTTEFCEPVKMDGQNTHLFARVQRLVAENYEV